MHTHSLFDEETFMFHDTFIEIHTHSLPDEDTFMFHDIFIRLIVLNRGICGIIVKINCAVFF